MKLSIYFACCSLLLCCALPACGRQAATQALTSPAPVADPAAAHNGLLQTLPGLARLESPARSLSLAGPGWLMLDHAAVLASDGMTPEAGTAIALDGAGGSAYAVFGVYGFDGDNGPTSLRVTSSSACSEFYAGFSDYENGKWVFAGPYSFAASGGTTEITIPNTGEYVSPHAFVTSTYAATYAAVIVPEGVQLSTATVELGVHGGQLGPDPVLSVFGLGGPDGMTVHWQNRHTVLNPDFAGYLVERAEQFTGGFTPINTDPITDDYIFDELAELDHIYRYRVAVEDVNGNRSLWTEGPGYRRSTGFQYPIPVIKGLPAGPVFGPAELSLDMSDSYDPSGAPITNYKIVDGADKVLFDDPGYALNLTLQPGCHVLKFIVTANGIDGTTNRYVKVYPRWRDGAMQFMNPQTQNTFPRMAGLGLVRLSDGSFCLSGADLFAPGFMVRQFKQGQPSKLSTRPMYSALQFFSEPFVINDDVFYLTSDDWHYDLYKYDGTRLTRMRHDSFSASQANAQVALAGSADGRLWAVYAEDDMGIKLQATNYSTNGDVVLVDPLPAPQCLDAAYDPTADALWVVYSAAAETRWLKLDPATLAVTGSGLLAAFASAKIDIEYDPTTSVPMVIYSSLGNIYYTYNDGTWHLGEQVDNSVTLSSTMDLETLAGKPRVLATEIAGTPRIYTRDGLNNWSQRTVDYTTAAGLNLALAAYSDGDGPAYGVGDIRVDRHVNMALLHGDNSETLIFDQWPTTGVGYQLHGVGGSDGLHVVMDQLLGNSVHLLGSADGLTWSGQPMPAGASQLDTSALADGTVYLSYYDGANNARLDRWDGAAWISVSAQPSQSDYRPILAHGRPRAIVSWAGFNDATLEWTGVEGDQTNGYDVTTEPFLGGLAWSGTALLTREYNPPGSRADYFVLSSDPAFTYISSSLNGFGGLTSGGVRILATLRDYKEMFDSYLFGRNMAAAEYVSSFAAGGIAVWCSNGTMIAPARYTPTVSHQGMITELPTDPSLPGYDLRRTVAAMTTPDVTAVGLVCDLSGQDQYLEWSNYGEWEALPLPGPDANYASDRYMNNAQIFCGFDGRWHIIYRNYDIDAVFIRSTL